ncbi:MAG TPA: SigE family RNA polymerase sigma factor [Acidimicrobiales bacterium]|nr:SigE family RNA polymerase sigma factor [Acidimicrobiales bacterium]
MSVPPGGVGRRSFLRGAKETPSTSDLRHGVVEIDGLAPGIDRRARRHADPLADLHREHYASLVRLASLVLADVGLAEQVVQDAFVKLHLRWGGLRHLDRAPAYLRSCVLNGARSQLRRQKVRDRYDARRTVAPAAGTPEASAVAAAEQERMVAALRRLPERQREALALRYFLDLPEAEIAAAMGVSAGSVKTHVHRGLAALAQLLGEKDQ